MRRWLVVVSWVGFTAATLACGGCGTSDSQEDLGTVVVEIPKVAGADAPYPMPELETEEKPTTPSAPDRPPPSADD